MNSGQVKIVIGIIDNTTIDRTIENMKSIMNSSKGLSPR